MTLYGALNFLFPSKCRICNKKGNFEICEKCINRIKRLEKVQILNFTNRNLNSLLYYFRYEGYIRKLILEFKFFNKYYLGKIFVQIILKNKKICGKLKFYDIIIPVPMYKTKKSERGYNQAEILAKNISKKLNIHYDNKILVKFVNNKKQSSLTKEDRYKNICGVFKIEKKDKILNKKVILVDDICTTSATLEECSKVLKNAGAKEVIALVIAKD